VRLVSKFKGDKNGEIVKVDNEGIYVNALDKTIVIEELQFPGKRKMKVSEYLKGNSIEKNIILE
jgi:methionyl-tRNA formyltransferase